VCVLVYARKSAEIQTTAQRNLIGRSTTASSILPPPSFPHVKIQRTFQERHLIFYFVELRQSENTGRLNA
jgi:hypothetical protein